MNGTLADATPSDARQTPAFKKPDEWLAALNELQRKVSDLRGQRIARAAEISELLWAVLRNRNYYHENVSSREFPQHRTIMVTVGSETAATRLRRALEEIGSPLIIGAIRINKIGKGQRHEVAFDLAPRPADPEPAKA